MESSPQLVVNAIQIFYIITDFLSVLLIIRGRYQVLQICVSFLFLFYNFCFMHFEALLLSIYMGFPDGAVVKNPPCQYRRRKRYRFDSWVWKIPWSRKWQPTPVFLPGKSHGGMCLADYSLWGHKESDTAKWLSTHTRCFDRHGPHAYSVIVRCFSRQGVLAPCIAPSSHLSTASLTGSSQRLSFSFAMSHDELTLLSVWNELLWP